MLSHAKEAMAYARGKSRADFNADRSLYLILTRLLEIVGEAASRVPKEERARYPGIEWGKAIGMRNIISHAYDFIDLNVVWDTVTNDLPPLIVELEKIAPPEK